MINNLRIILSDVDGVVVKQMLREWLRRYNNDWNDDLRVEDITQWSMLPFVKPECGKKIYNYLFDVDFYDNLVIDEETLWGVRKLQEIPDTLVVFLSGGIGGALGKYNILKRHGLISNEMEFISASNKGLIYGDVMLDDYEQNIYAFRKRNPSGLSFLFDAKYNENVRDVFRVKKWSEVVNLLNV